MKIEEDKRNQIIGELLTREKYKFLPDGAIGEIIRDFVDEYNKE